MERRSSVSTDTSLFSFSETQLKPGSPKDLELTVISAKLACSLNGVWHSRLPYIHWSNVVRNTHYVCYGFRYKSRWYAVGIWSSPVAQNRFKNGNEILELRRLAICDECPKNTATRMIKLMVKDIKERFEDIRLLISYQDTDVHAGTIYSASSWTKAAKSDGLLWNTTKRKRNVEQTTAPKIRWEKQIKPKYKKYFKTLKEDNKEKHINLI